MTFLFPLGQVQPAETLGDLMTKGLLFAAVLGLSLAANAQTSSTTLSTPSVESGTQKTTTSVGDVLKNKKFEDDKDITDSKLKAESGSLSRYSLKFSLSYFGPPIGDLDSKLQPNPDGSIGVNQVSLSGSISGRYRLDSKAAISAGTGINVLTPFQGAERTDVKTPFISYDRNARLGDVQVRNSYGASLTTVPNFREVGQYSSLSYDNSLVYNIGSSGVAVGLDTGLSVFLYERGYEPKDGKASRYHLGFYPQVKYNFSDKLNVYTSVAMNFWNPRYRDGEMDLLNKTLSGRVGMGYAFSRDIYFAPYLNYYPKDARTESTTLSFSTIFSIL
ncbi:hypothetical protein predicted by Glimmer/Critica [Bdellovibrio bacteriovorus HD100]|uniref:DUF3570 domain-containing protein n=2 Tax=Bdellovibrio bacteriovorus TaxID=959 RepID=Q6MQ34_BDEBA|nr:hypothetical protein predicted by Glimmer/Critica [Bdellovibrio bacteriovorus HD100]